MDAVEQLCRHAADVARVRVLTPPLVARLVGRPPAPGMTANFARLSGAYVAARALIGGGVDVPDYRPEVLRDPQTLALASRIAFVAVDNADPNALVPIAVELTLSDGRQLSESVDTVYGHPSKPMTRAAHLDKFRRNLANAQRPVPPENGERLIAPVDEIESVDDVSALVDWLTP